MMDLSGKVALITGAGSGIARATSLLLATQGAAIACLDIDATTAAETAGQIQALGGTSVWLKADLRDERQVEAATDRCFRELGSPHILVNAAGSVVRGRLTETTTEQWNRVIATNLTGCFLCIRAVVPRMAQAGGGSIVQICSIAAHVGYSGCAYAASKGALLAMTRQLAYELAPLNIRINSVSPGPIDTPLTRSRFADARVREETESRIPAHRLGAPDDVAHAVRFLVSSDASYINGTDLIVDGGLISSIPSIDRQPLRLADVERRQ